MSARTELDESMHLGLGPGIRLQLDKVRDAWTLMAPERVLVLDEIAHEVVAQIVDSDGGLAGVIDRLAEKFDAPRAEIAADVIQMLQPLVDKQLLRVK